MSDTQQCLVAKSGVKNALKQLSYINPDAQKHSLITVTKSVEVPLVLFGQRTLGGKLNLRGSIVEVTQVDKSGFPALFRVYKEGVVVAWIEPAKPADFPHKVVYYRKAVQGGVVTPPKPLKERKS